MEGRGQGEREKGKKRDELETKKVFLFERNYISGLYTRLDESQLGMRV